MHITLPVLVTKIRKSIETLCDITYMYIQLYEYHIIFLLVVPLLLKVSPLLTVLRALSSTKMCYQQHVAY
jgi:hypothetical protein